MGWAGSCGPGAASGNKGSFVEDPGHNCRVSEEWRLGHSCCNGSTCAFESGGECKGAREGRWNIKMEGGNGQAAAGGGGEKPLDVSDCFRATRRLGLWMAVECNSGGPACSPCEQLDEVDTEDVRAWE